MSTTIPGGIIYRAATVTPAGSRTDRRREMSFASGAEVRRPWGIEVLKMTPDAWDLDRIRTDGPVLINHDRNQLVAKVEDAWLGGGKAHVAMLFGTSPLAVQALEDLDTGLRRGASFGYTILEMIEITGPSDEERKFLVTKLEVLEVTLETIPADITVGVGRGLPAPKKEGSIMSIKNTINDQANAGELPSSAGRESRDEIREMRRRSEIREAGDCFEAAAGGRDGAIRSLVQQHLAAGSSLEQFRQAATQLVETSLAIGSGPHERARIGDGLDLSPRDRSRFSLVRAVRAMALPNEARYQQDAAFEFEVSSAYGERIGKPARGLWIPHEVMTRDITKAGSGGNLIATELRPELFIDALRKRAILLRLCTGLYGLRGDVNMSRQAVASAAGWIGEDEDAPSVTPVFDTVSLTHKTCAAHTYFTRKMLKQSTPDVDQLAQNDLVKAVALGVDHAGFQGSGIGAEPLGILYQSSVGLIALGDNGAVATHTHIVGLETEVASEDADVMDMAYVTTPGMRGSLKRQPKDSGSGQFVWENLPPTNDPLAAHGMMNGYKAFATNQVPSELVKGTNSDCHAIIFGDFKSVVIGMWGGVDVVVDPYSSSKKGGVNVTVFQDADIALRTPQSLAVIVDARVG